MRPLRRLTLVVGTAAERVAHADPLDDEDFVLEVNLAVGFRGQLAFGGVDPARLQRAPEGAGESTGRRRDDVIERRGMVGILPGRGAVVLADGAVGAKRHGLFDG